MMAFGFAFHDDFEAGSNISPLVHLLHMRMSHYSNIDLKNTKMHKIFICNWK